ncbi:MAG: DUF2723 domain-containing protein [Anaerolineae bacterium]|nr:DUF2723 domain-containing protein [Anaerolineae bacterium]
MAGGPKPHAMFQRVAGLRPLTPPRVFGLLLWVAVFTLYAATTARDVLPADSGEFQFVAARWGIAHPPGYPLYTLAGALWMRLLPLGRAAYKLNLLSAALAATALWLLFEAVRAWSAALRLSPRAGSAGGLAAALLLGNATTFWAQATIANIRMPTLLFVAWGFWALAKWEQRRGTDQEPAALVELALALGLGVGHHPSLVFVAVGWGGYILLQEPKLLIQPRRWWKAAVVAAPAWLIPQLYLVLRSRMENVALSPGNLLNWNSFWNHVLARGFGGDMFAITGGQELWLRLRMLPSYFRLQFPAPFLVAIALSWLWLTMRRPKLSIGLLLSWGMTTFTTITYRAPQTVEYLAPAYVPMALALGMGMAALAGWSNQTVHGVPVKLRPAVVSIILLWLLVRFPLHIPDFATMAADASIRTRTAPLLESAPPDALILADWHWATALWVLQTEDMRPDAEVAYVYPIAGQNYEDVWRARAEAAGERPLYSTHAYGWPEWTFAPVGGGFRLYRRPLEAIPDDLGFTILETDMGSVKLLGYRWAKLETGGQPAHPGQQMELQLAWRAQGPQEPAPSFTARLWTPDGALLAQADRALGSETAQGEVRFVQLTLQLPIDTCSGVIYPQVSAYTVQNGEFQDLGGVSLPEQPMTCDFPTMPAKDTELSGIVLPRGPILRDIDYDVREDAATAYLHWCGPGQGMVVTSGEQRAYVFPLAPGRCQTVRLPVAMDAAAGATPPFEFSDETGASLPWLGRTFPAPKPGERYIPFGDAFVLVGSRMQEHGDQLVVDLQWHTVRPTVNDFAVSVRLFDANRTQLGPPHDMQPALGTFPTLKWNVRDIRILDTHTFPIPGTPVASVDVSVYERFRITPVRGATGEVVSYPAPGAGIAPGAAP